MYESDDEDNEFNGYLESANESQGFAQHSAQHTTDGEFKLEMDDDELTTTLIELMVPPSLCQPWPMRTRMRMEEQMLMRRTRLVLRLSTLC